MKFSKKHIVLIYLISAQLYLFAQKPEKDFQIWGNFEVESPINKRWMIHVQHQSRFINNATQYGYSYFDAGGLFRIGRNLRFTFNYIFADKKRTDISFSYRHQFEGYFTYRKKIGKFTFFDRGKEGSFWKSSEGSSALDGKK